MINNFKGKTAVLTGAGSGFGLECARIGARLGMNLVLVDVQQDALDKAEAEMKALGVQVLARKVDVSNAEQMQALADAVTALLAGADGSNNEVRIVVRETGEVVGAFGRSGRHAGDFHWIHNIAIDTTGNVYTAEVDNAKRAQKFRKVR